MTNRGTLTDYNMNMARERMRTMSLAPKPQPSFLAFLSQPALPVFGRGKRRKRHGHQTACCGLWAAFTRLWRGGDPKRTARVGMDLAHAVPKSTGMQLDPLARRLSVNRLSLTSSSQFGAWYKDSDDVRSQSTGRWYVLHPISSARIAWDYTLVAIVLATVFIVPFRLAFIHESQEGEVTDGANGVGGRTLIGIDVALDVLCWIDLASNFFFGFVTINTASAKQELVSDCRRIALRYCRRWFIIELLSVGFPPFQACAALSRMRGLVDTRQQCSTSASSSSGRHATHSLLSLCRNSIADPMFEPTTRLTSDSLRRFSHDLHSHLRPRRQRQLAHCGCSGFRF